MGFVLAANRPVSVELRRVAIAQARECQALLKQTADPVKRDVSIHEVRKRLKQLRALVRLTRRRPHDPDADQLNMLLREAGRQLSTARDVIVAAQTLEDLAASQPELSAPLLARARDVLTRAREVSVHGPQELDIAIKQASQRIAAFRTSVRRMFKHMTAPLLLEAYLRTYRRSRRTLRAFAGQMHIELGHDCRKRAKDLWYQSRLLKEVLPAGVCRSCKRLKRFTDMLGRANDLAVLSDLLRRGLLQQGVDTTSLDEAIARRQKRLWRKAARLGKQVHRAKAAELAMS